MSNEINAAEWHEEPAGSGEDATVINENTGNNGGGAAEEISVEDLIQRLAQEVEANRVKAEKYYRNLLRMEADFDNFRRRTKQEKEEIQLLAAERVITDLLPVLDNLERGLEAAEKSRDFEGLLAGLQMVYRGFRETLSREGLQKIEVIGQEFDPNLHEAISRVPAANSQEDNLVVQELQKGYKMREKVIRPARVTVARESEEYAENNGENNH